MVATLTSQNVGDRVDWDHYKKHKDTIDENVKDVLEKGVLQDMGHPPGPTLEITARAICTILHKDPKKAKALDSSKPLTASQKRKFDRQRPPDKVIEYELKEGEGFNIIPNEEYQQPPSVPYIKDGKKMPEGWQPFQLESTGPLTSAKRGQGPDTECSALKNLDSDDKDVEEADRPALPTEPGQ